MTELNAKIEDLNAEIHGLGAESRLCLAKIEGLTERLLTARAAVPRDEEVVTLLQQQIARLDQQIARNDQQIADNRQQLAMEVCRMEQAGSLELCGHACCGCCCRWLLLRVMFCVFMLLCRSPSGRWSSGLVS